MPFAQIFDLMLEKIGSNEVIPEDSLYLNIYFLFSSEESKHETNKLIEIIEKRINNLFFFMFKSKIKNIYLF